MRAVLLPSLFVSSPAPNRSTSRWFLPASYPTDRPLGISFLTTMALQAARAQYCAAVDDACQGSFGAWPADGAADYDIGIVYYIILNIK